jgi:hypothetical protein
MDGASAFSWSIKEADPPEGNDRKKSKCNGKDRKSQGNDKNNRRSFDFAPFGRCAQDDNMLFLIARRPKATASGPVLLILRLS